MTRGKSMQPAPLLWPVRPLPAAIAPGAVHVWAWHFGGASEPLAADLALLDDQERQRTTRFYFAPDRVRYSVCHANMRQILGTYVDRDPKSLVFYHTPGGKPELELMPSGPRLRFNLSHSKTVALLAVGLDVPLGVDVEDIRPIERGVARRFFSPAEVESMSGLEGVQWLEAFYRCWTRKEAILKAEGLGLRIPLDSFDVSLRAGEPAALLAARPASNLTAAWRLHDLSVCEGTMAALAVGDPAVQVSIYCHPR